MKHSQKHRLKQHKQQQISRIDGLALGLAFGMAWVIVCPPPPSRSPIGVPSFIYVWVVWEENFVVLGIAVFKSEPN